MKTEKPSLPKPKDPASALSRWSVRARSASVQGDVSIEHMCDFLEAIETSSPVSDETRRFFEKAFRRFVLFSDAHDSPTNDEKRRALASALQVQMLGRGKLPLDDIETSRSFRVALQVHDLVTLARDREDQRTKVGEAIQLVADRMHLSTTSVNTYRRRHAEDVKEAASNRTVHFEDVWIPARQCLEIAQRLHQAAGSGIRPVTFDVMPGLHEGGEATTATFPPDPAVLRSVPLHSDDGPRDLAWVLASCAPASVREVVFDYLLWSLETTMLSSLGQYVLTRSEGSPTPEAAYM